MDRILSSGTDAPPRCCICNAGFKGGGLNYPRKEQLPRVLKCAHSSCGKCILACLNVKKPITCGVCQEVSPYPPNYKEEDIQTIFPVNAYILGLWSKRTNEYYGDSQISFSNKAVKKEMMPTQSNTLCDECTGPATCFCESCLSAYCHPCFKKVHSAAKVFRDHRSVSLVQAWSSKKPNSMCATHRDKKLEFFCTQCSVSICSSCLVSEHNGHNLKSLADQNRELEDQIVTSYAKVTDVMNIMKMSCKKARQALKDSNEGSLNSSHEQEIKHHFVQLHAQLEIMENDLRQKLNSSSGITSLKAIVENLSKNIDRIKTNLAKTQIALRSDGSVDAMDLLQELRELEHLPCVLVAPENNDNGNRLEIDTTIFKTLINHIVLCTDDPMLYELKTENDAPDKDLIDLPSTSSVEKFKTLLLAPQTSRPPSSNDGFPPADYYVEESVRAVSPTISHCSSSSSLTSNNSFVMEATHLLVPPDDLVVGITFNAFVSHITSPSDFYIQLSCARRKLDFLQRELRRYGSRKPLAVKRLYPGQCYMTLYSGDHNWSRCKILDHVSPREVKVLYIDFGNHQKVLNTNLRLLPDALAKIPPLAVRCSIFNCNPRQNNQWDPKAVSVMSRMVEGKGSTSITIVRKNQLNCLTIKLYKETETNIIDVGEALIFLEFAQYGPSESFTPDMEDMRNPKAYPAQMLLRSEYVQHKTVVLPHVVSPEEFYIVLSPVPTEVQLMWKSMTIDYSTADKRAKDSRIVYYPAIGMAVAVPDNEGLWRRAIVVEMLPNKLVKIFLVDDGPTCLVEWDKLRTLELKYFKLQPQAYRCAMADIQPRDGMKWTEEAATLIQSYKGKTLCISNPEPKINHTRVLLIHSENEVDICVNALMVREGLAESTGPYGEIVEYPKIPILVTPEEPEKPLVGKQNEDFKSASLPKRRQPVKPVKKTTAQISEQGKELVKESNGELKLKVTIERVVNPGEFYISVDRNAHLYEEVNVKMNAFYENVDLNCEQRIWQLGDKCAVKADDGSWKRAVIVEKPETEEHLEVRLVDDGSATMSVSSTSGNLAVLDPQFCYLPDRVIECTLGGIVPAGSSSWTLTSISEMSDFVDTYKDNLYIASMKLPGCSNPNVLRVLLLGRKKSKPTAIAPAYESWPSLNHMLRWKGCAKADEFTKWDHKGNIISERYNVMEDEIEVLSKLLRSTFHTTPEGVLDLSKPKSNGLDTNKIKWHPANPLSTLTFIAKPTYIGSDCDVWIQDPLTAVKNLHKINAEANKLCEGTDPPDASMWETGDICLAKYHLDGQWYRSEIIELNATRNHHLVRFVDYGNEEYLENHEIRLPDGMTMRPIQAYVCYFDNLAPIGNTWSASHIDAIHSLLVDKHVGIELRELTNNMLGIVKMTLPDGRDALSEIVSLRLGLYRTSLLAESSEVDSKPEKPSEDNSHAMKAICETTNGGDVATQVEDAASNPTIVTNWLNIYETEDNYELPKGGFHLLTIPPDVNEIEVDVTSIWSPNLCTIQISTTDNAELKSISDSYDGLVKAMQEGAPSQPNLEPPYLFKECCCKYEEDGMWYRAVVINDSSEIDGTLAVQYVDYGNVQKNLVDQVKQMEETWFSVPVQSIPCCIDGYTFRPDVPNIEAMLSLQHVLIEQPFVKAVIKERGKNLLVEFYNKEDNLCYQPLIDSHHLLPCTSS